MKAKTKMSSSKKILIASLLVGLLLIGSIITVVAVLAAQTQTISSSVSVSYIVDGVAVKTSATYATVPNEGLATKLAMSGDDGSELTFNAQDSQTEKNLDPANITLTSTTRKVVYEYKFTNLAESAFTISLTDQPTASNMNVYYRVSATEIAANKYQDASSFPDTAGVMTQAMVEKDRSIYIYIVAEIKDDNQAASYNGTIEWTMLYVAPETLVEVALDNGEGTGGQDTIKVVPNVAMPVIYELPVAADSSQEFSGYYSAESEGIQYVKSDGTSASSVGATPPTTLYAQYKVKDTENLSAIDTVTMNGTVITGMTDISRTTGEVIIPSTATEIAESAFENETSLTKVTYEDSTVNTVSYADITSSLTTIGASAFKGCSGLVEIEIPENVVSIGDYAFYDTVMLEKIYFNAIECNSFNDGHKTFMGCGSNSSGVDVVFGDGVLSVPGLIFYYHTSSAPTPMAYSSTTTNIISVSMSNSVTTIGDYAFFDCSNLKSVVLSENLTTISNFAFYSCENLSTLVLPNSITQINSSAFGGCSSLTSVILPDNLIQISDSAFQGCSSLGSIIITSNVRHIGGYAFNGCSNLTNVTFENVDGWFLASSYTDTSGTDIVVTDSSTNAINLTSGGEWISKILLRAEVEYFTYSEDGLTITGVTEYGANASELVIPEGVTAIGDSAFDMCENLISITISESVTTIGDYAFQNCSSLTSIVIPKKVKSIGKSCFVNCSSLESVTFERISDSTESSLGIWCYSSTATTSYNGFIAEVSNPETNAINFVSGDWKNYYIYFAYTHSGGSN